MFKRIFIFLLILVIVFAIIGYKMLSWRPDILASFTGKNFLLNTSLAALIDIEKLYSVPEDNLDIAVLKAQIEETRSAVMHPAVRESKLNALTHKLNLLTGKEGIRSIDDAKDLFKASELSYTNLSSSNSEVNTFFHWEGPFCFIADDYYFVCFTKPDFTKVSSDKTVEIDGFSMHEIRKWFTDSNLRPETNIRVVGRYVGKSELQLANGQKALVPLLVDCYIERK